MLFLPSVSMFPNDFAQLLATGSVGDTLPPRAVHSFTCRPVVPGHGGKWWPDAQVH